MPRQSPGSGARRVNQDAIESVFERERLRTIERDQLHVSNARSFESFRHRADAVPMQVRGDYVPLRTGSARKQDRLASWSGAKIEDRVSLLDRQ
jgi:hypothetical protein